MVPGARLQRTNGSSLPLGEGWFVLNAADARWLGGDLGCFTRFEGEPPFPQIGINISVLKPGEPASPYHRENEQEVTTSGEQAYATSTPDLEVPYQQGWLPCD
jgi:hypothetical protein